MCSSSYFTFSIIQNLIFIFYILISGFNVHCACLLVLQKSFSWVYLRLLMLISFYMQTQLTRYNLYLSPPGLVSRRLFLHIQGGTHKPWRIWDGNLLHFQQLSQWKRYRNTSKVRDIRIFQSICTSIISVYIFFSFKQRFFFLSFPWKF